MFNFSTLHLFATDRNLTPFQRPFTGNLFLNCLVDSPYQHDPQCDFRFIWMTSGILKAPKIRDLWLHGMLLPLLKFKDPEGDANPNQLEPVHKYFVNRWGVGVEVSLPSLSQCPTSINYSPYYVRI